VIGKKIVVLGTGGTLAGTSSVAGDNVGYTAAQIGVAQLLAEIPALRALPLECEQVAQVDSKDMSFAIWCELARRCAHWLAHEEVGGIVVTHGTDTLEETAYFLQEVLCPSKPVAITCAMRPATALSPDGPQNIVDAVAVARADDARGVVAVCAGVIHGAREVMKMHNYRLDPFSSGDAGPIGYVEEGKLRQVRDWEQGDADLARHRLEKVLSAAKWPRVEIVMSHAGADGSIVQALVQGGVAGLVVAGTGNGTLHHALEVALLRAEQAGVVVRRATRCLQGRVLPHAGDRFPAADGLSPVKARIALMLELMA
jgi:L-asparaginase